MFLKDDSFNIVKAPQSFTLKDIFSNNLWAYASHKKSKLILLYSWMIIA